MSMISNIPDMILRVMGTAKHLEGLEKLGVTRTSFEPVKRTLVSIKERQVRGNDYGGEQSEVLSSRKEFAFASKHIYIPRSWLNHC